MRSVKGGHTESAVTVRVNIEIMRAFVKLRRMLASNTELARKLDELEKKYDKQFAIIFEAIRQLMITENKPKKKIGFEVKEPKTPYGKGKKGPGKSNNRK